MLLSSHLLHEIEVIADDLIVIGNGRVVAHGAKTDLLRSAGTIVRSTDQERITRALDESGVTSSVVGPDGLLVHATCEEVGHIACAAQVQLLELREADGAGLEEMFLELTAETQREATGDHHPRGAVA